MQTLSCFIQKIVSLRSSCAGKLVLSPGANRLAGDAWQ